MKKQIYIIGIGGIGISAIARYYLHIGYKVSGSDSTSSELIETLKKEGCEIQIGEFPEKITHLFPPHSHTKQSEGIVIYSEAISREHSELQKAKMLGIKTLSYPQALGNITKNKKLITIAGTHGKSTTAILASLILKNSEVGVNTIVGTLVKEFDFKNTYFSESDYFVIEACEYKRSFLHYQPSVAVITNIELDHLDYYKDLEDYISSFEEYINQVHTGGFVILNGNDPNSTKLIGKRKDIQYIQIFHDYALLDETKYPFPKMHMQVPGEHILFDAHISYMIGYMMGIKDSDIIAALEAYTGAWRRMEVLGITKNHNTVISDYAHHPTEIKCSLKALKAQYPDKTLYTVFQPHQYSRTLELLDDFRYCFSDTDILIISNIYEARDSEVDKKKINAAKFVSHIVHHNKQDGKSLKNTLQIIKEYDHTNPKTSIILLLGAGDIDDLRYDLPLY